MVRVYRIQTQSWVFYAKVIKESKNIYIIQIESQNRTECIILYVGKNKPDAHLQTLTHDARCSSNQPMPRHIGIRTIVNATIHFLTYQFHYVKQLLINDIAYFTCDNKQVRTSNMMFLLYGKTLYERYFNAYPDREEPYRALQRIYTSIAPCKIPFKVLWEEIFSRTSLSKKELKTLYDTATSYQDFFKSIYHRHQCKPFYYITTNHKLFKPYGTELSSLHATLWYIPIDKDMDEGYVITRLDKKAGSSIIEWKEPTEEYMRMMGNCIMYLGDEID